jgi:hypothetical protein
MTPAVQVKQSEPVSALNKKEFAILLQHEKTPSISICMPIHSSAKDSREDVIRLRNLLHRAEAELLARGISVADVRVLLRPAEQLTAVKNLPSKGKGFAVFAAENFFLAYDLPVNPLEHVIIGNRFHIRPLLPLVSGEDRFYVLALSQKHVRLLHGTRYAANEIHLDSVPANLRETFGQESFERQSQFHTASRADGGNRPISHGSNAEIKDRIVRFLRRVDTSVMNAIRDHGVPLMLAGVNYLLPLYREVNSYPALVEEVITGNPDGSSPEELRAAGWEIMHRQADRKTRAALDNYKELAGSAQASSNLREVLAGAQQGRILSLFLAEGAEQWGLCEPGLGAVHPHGERQPGDEDLLNLAAIHTLRHGGHVSSVSPGDLPAGASLVAVFRF